MGTQIIATGETGTALQVAGQVANGVASHNVFERYQEETAGAKNTHTAQQNDLGHFSSFLAEALAGTGEPAPTGEQLYSDPSAWGGVTWGLLESFKLWARTKGYAISTINRRLTTVRVYVGLASQAGTISPDELRMLQTVKGYTAKAAKRIDADRLTTRRGHKKAEHVSLTAEQVQALKEQPDTAQGRRDALLLCLLLDHGLRVGEVAFLRVTDFDPKQGMLRFYRQKVEMEQTLKLTADTLRALHNWINSGNCPAMGAILRGSRKGGALIGPGMTERAITKRVRTLGEEIGIQGLSAHDCRHYWATYWAKQVEKGRISLLRLQEAGGWKSLAMPRHYVEWAQVANEGMT